jgi:beta-galactosidase
VRKLSLYAVAATFCAGAAVSAVEPAKPVNGAGQHDAKRTIISLDGEWQIAEGMMGQAPANFNRTVPVPGLVSLATPAFDAAAPKVAKRESIPQKDPKREAFWYRRTFSLDRPVPAVATLKVAKAMFGTRVFLNGKLLGDHLPSFTPGYFDARSALKNGRNEILIRLGADRDAVGRIHPDGFDFEKERYIPGIFDSVELILSGTPHFLGLQTAPDLGAKSVRVQAVLCRDNGAAPLPGQAVVRFVVREARSGKVAGTLTSVPVDLATDANATVDVRIPLDGCRPWSPEDPFLYTLEADSGSDSIRTRFGMREFKFDAATGRAMLNGKPYFMRGSNITLYRFFEDSECGKLPWNEKWVRLLHRRVKEMHWNCLRYCIGFPPEAWYDIADETGILIDDEFPIWYGGDVPKELPTEELVKEYAEWMRERWNHPCVAIWDACNETLSPKTGAALKQVRAMDLSHRPWDNGYSRPQEPGDMFESHPYHFFGAFRLRNLATANPQPGDGSHAVVVNEYGWHWVNRDGTPTTLTSELYRNVLGADATPARRFHMQATWLAADTEFWRAHRKAAAVMHFTTLGYSRPDGQTCDHWTAGGVAGLQWEPEFYRYVRDAFAPVGLMVDYWNDRPCIATKAHVPVIVSNDLNQPWQGMVTLSVKQGERLLFQARQECRIEPLGQGKAAFDVAWPERAGPYVLQAELRGADGEPVHSIRELEIQDAASLGLAYQKPVTASSTHSAQYKPENAVDGDPGTYWSSSFEDNAWLAVDLLAPKKIGRARIQWENAFAKAFSIQVSADGKNWTDVYRTNDGNGGTSEIKFAPVEARHVRLVCTKRGTQWGNAVYEIGVFEK